jgi:ATPase subunit of ABC transporter with duplicated ATPase domains
MRKEYEAQMEYRKNLQAFIDRWRYNANRGRLFHVKSFMVDLRLVTASQAQMRIKQLEKVTVILLATPGVTILFSFQNCNYRMKKRPRNLGKVYELVIVLTHRCVLLGSPIAKRLRLLCCKLMR